MDVKVVHFSRNLRLTGTRCPVGSDLSRDVELVVAIAAAVVRSVVGARHPKKDHLWA